MSIFINNGEHPEVFKTNEPIQDSNQELFQHDYFSEMMAKQKQTFENLAKAMQELKKKNSQQVRLQNGQWQNIGLQLNDLKEKLLEHDDHEKVMADWLKKLQEEHRQLHTNVTEEHITKQKLHEEIQAIRQETQAIIQQLQEFKTANEKLTSQMTEQVEVQKHVSDQIEKQAHTQQEVLERMDKQEAMAEKMLRQLDQIRFVIYERASNLVDKIENGYKLTTSYVYHLMNGKKQPFTIHSPDTKHRDEPKRIE